jgi:hypothetical protein
VNKPVLGIVVGGVLGLLDGLSALLHGIPEVNAQIQGIVIGSTFKGLVAGVLIGFFARKVNSLPLGIVFGLAVGLGLAYLVCLANVSQGQPPYYWEIMLPGSLVGAIVGYATQRYGAPAAKASPA